MTSLIPQGTVTFLFTDIEGSTRLWENHANWMRSAFARQEALLREAIAAHHGYAYKMVGDSIQAAFNTAQDALLAALEGQRLLTAEPWGEQTLRVRMALHAGATQGRSDEAVGDAGYVGPALNRIVSLMAIGHGGQVLLSHAVVELVSDHLPPGVSLVDMGTHRLRDLVRPEHIYQLVGPGLSVAFPPLKTIDSFPNNLPVQLTSFVGREKDLAEVKRLLYCERMVTLTGPGGCGKTRLALDLAGELLKEYLDGVWFVDLSLLTGENLVIPAIAAVFGLQETAGQSISDALLVFLRPKQCLLVIDNCEHLLGGAAQAAEFLLGVCPSLKILATSREPLHIPGEWTWPVQPLSLPPVTQLSTGQFKGLEEPARLLDSEAVRLFVERAQTVMPTFQLTRENALLIARICYWLDGIPLAIELAAARVRMLSVGVIAGRLDRSLELLTGGSRVAQKRQQTLRAAIDWSYNLLEPEEQAMFRRLAVFSGGFMLEAVEAVCCCSTGDPTMILMQLVDKSLVVVEDLEEGGEALSPGGNGDYVGNRRYRLLETMREYAWERLEASGEKEGYQRSHVAYYLSLAEKHDPELATFRPDPRPDLLKVELGNLWLALTWCQERGAAEVETWLRLAGGLWRFWWVSGLLAAGIRWLEQALALNLGPQEARWRAQVRFLALKMHSGDYENSYYAIQKVVQQLQEAGQNWNAAFALGSLNDLYPSLLHSPARAKAFFEEALRLARLTRQRWLIAFALCHAVGYNLGPEPDRRRELARLQESLSTARSLDDPWLVAYILRHYAHFLVTEASVHTGGAPATVFGGLAQARLFCEECLSINRRLGDHLSTAHALLALADITYRQKEVDPQEAFETAACFLEERLALERRVENRYGIPRSLNTLGILHYHRGDYARARQCYQESLALFLEIGNDWDIANAWTSLGIIGLTEPGSDLIQARDDLLRGLEIYARHREMIDEVAGALQALACLAFMADETILAAVLLAVGEKYGPVVVFGDLYGQVCWLKMGQMQSLKESIRKRLGQVEFTDAWEEGQALLSIEACDMARRSVRALELSQVHGSGLFSLPPVLEPSQRRLEPSLHQPVTAGAEAQALVEPLTDRELEVLDRLSAGLTNQEIARDLTIDLGTVKSHNTHIFQKLGVKNRTQAVARGRALGLTKSDLS